MTPSGHVCSRGAQPCGARIHDRGGDLLLLAAGRDRQAAIWYSCVRPSRTCFRRIRYSARLISCGRCRVGPGRSGQGDGAAWMRCSGAGTRPEPGAGGAHRQSAAGRTWVFARGLRGRDLHYLDPGASPGLTGASVLVAKRRSRSRRRCWVMACPDEGSWRGMCRSRGMWPCPVAQMRRRVRPGAGGRRGWRSRRRCGPG